MGLPKRKIITVKKVGDAGVGRDTDMAKLSLECGHIVYTALWKAKDLVGKDIGCPECKTNMEQG